MLLINLREFLECRQELFNKSNRKVGPKPLDEILNKYLQKKKKGVFLFPFN